MLEISRDELDAAEGSLDEAKAAYLAVRNGRGPRARLTRRFKKNRVDVLRDAYRTEVDACSRIRQAWREQETAAGRRRGVVGGDAFAERS